MHTPGVLRFNFDIDRYIDPYLPRSPLYRLPRPISRFLGYRDRPRKNIGSLITWTESFIGAFCGVALIEGVVKSSQVIQSHGPPLIIGSFGASAILAFNTIESPLAQPRSLVLGHFLSALVGVCIAKLFELLPQAQFDDLQWLAGALAVAIASVVMSITKTIHPPAGATALLAVTNLEIANLGWYLLPLVLLCSTLMLVCACVTNNIARQFPMYWWTPVDLTHKLHRRSSSAIERVAQVEEEDEKDESSGRLSRAKTKEEIHLDREHEIKITAERIIIPDWLVVDDWERSVLEILRERIQEGTNESVDVSSTLEGGSTKNGSV